MCDAGGGDPALGRVAGVLILAERAGALDARAGGDDALGQAGDGRAGLKRRAGRILTQQRAVEQRLVVRLGDGLVILLALEERLQVERRVVGDGQRLAGGDVDRDERAAADGVAGFRRLRLHVLDALGQRLLGSRLQVEVDREADLIARLGLRGIRRAGDGAGRVFRDDGRAVRAVEIFFKGELRPVLADGRAHGVVLGLVGGVFLGSHQARVAEQVRREIRVVLARIGHRDLEAGDVIFLQGRDELHARVLDEHIVRQVELVDIARLDRVAQAGDDAHISRGIIVVDLKLFAAVAHELHGRGLLVEAGVFEKALELRALRVVHVRIFKRGRGRDRQLVDIRVAAGGDGARHLQEDAVRVILLEEVVGVEDEVIAAGVRHEHAAVAVEDAAARSLHGLGAGDAVAVFLIVRLAVDDLQLIERDDEHDHEQHEEARERGDAAGFDGFFHSEDPFGGRARRKTQRRARRR